MLITNGENLRLLCPNPGTCRKTMFRLADCIGKINLTDKAP